MAAFSHTPSAYSIRDLEHITGVKAFTLRMWERRYGILKPKRSDTNIRSYTNNELQELLNIALLNKHGYKISQIAAMPKSEIQERIYALQLAPSGADDSLQELTAATLDFDEARFDQLYTALLHRLGFEETVETVLFPLLQRIGALWQLQSLRPAQEHFLSNLIRRKLLMAFEEGRRPAGGAGPKAVLFLPAHELHELVLLYVACVLSRQGFRVVYLGQAVPPDDLPRITESVQPDVYVTMLTHGLAAPALTALLQQLRAGMGAVPCLLGGQALQAAAALPEGMRLIHDRASLLRQIEVE